MFLIVLEFLVFTYNMFEAGHLVPKILDFVVVFICSLFDKLIPYNHLLAHNSSLKLLI